MKISKCCNPFCKHTYVNSELEVCSRCMMVKYCCQECQWLISKFTRRNVRRNRKGPKSSRMYAVGTFWRGYGRNVRMFVRDWKGVRWGEEKRGGEVRGGGGGSVIT